MPSVICFQRKAENNVFDTLWREHLDTTLLHSEYTHPERPRNILTENTYRLLSANTEKPAAGTLVALDAEFVALQQEEIEVKADGSREVVRPSRSGLARVSVLRGSGLEEGVPFLDDYIATKEPVVDYLTDYSGIHPGDLDVRLSRHNVIPLKVSSKATRSSGLIHLANTIITDCLQKTLALAESRLHLHWSRSDERFSDNKHPCSEEPGTRYRAALHFEKFAKEALTTISGIFRPLIRDSKTNP